MTSAPSTPRIRASELVGETWFNTGDKDLSLKDLRGKIVILDFWAFCCVNCLHVLDELRPLEAKYADVLVTIGVHSPKFDYEAETSAVAAAIERYDIAHPVINDPELITWQAYTARAWPTLVVVDPEGYVVAHLTGEGHVSGLYSLIDQLVEEHEAKGTLHRGEGPYVAPEPVARDLKFPSKAIALGARGTQAGSFLIADTGHHRLVEVAEDLETVLQTIGGNGTGTPVSQEAAQANPELISVRGHADGNREIALFNEPQGLALLPEDIAAQVGYDVLIADAVNHRLRAVNLATGEVSTVAGNGVQRLIDSERVQAETASDEAETVDLAPFTTEAVQTSLSTPWDVQYSEAESKAIIAMAGTHQLFSYDPVSKQLAIYAGTGLEGLLDGPADEAWLAQSSGLSIDAEGTLWVADSETSAVRYVIPSTKSGSGKPEVGTVVGTGLFDFGFRDGKPQDARLQHPLGVTNLPDGSVLIADTYNHAIRRWAPQTLNPDGTTKPAEVTTVARDLQEPSDILVETDAEGTAVSIVVVETNAHQLVRISVPEKFLHVDEGAMQVQRPPTKLVAGDIPINISFTAPKGQKLDDRWGDPTQLTISSTPENLLLEGEGRETGLTRQLRLNPEITEGVLHVTARAAACDGEHGQPIPDSAACHLYQQDWGIPVTIHADTSDGAHDKLDLDLRGIH
ncbi:MAG TPA: redoxin domain-containing protein [Enteractinococcus helveticum]|uniref:Redoxin domain-containing protein n=1 Tax=Enteractinococcus helveticum TaxID=1837282 RepID=A0A921FP95_9MICC|nr:NHL domain-containing thioredoxin family protein [Enteractinococcus helveticum]HJF15415.1 redoxin domain-containing protein [Enteractinococcus helveticum]